MYVFYSKLVFKNCTMNTASKDVYLYLYIMHSNYIDKFKGFELISSFSTIAAFQ